MKIWNDLSYEELVEEKGGEQQKNILMRIQILKFIPQMEVKKKVFEEETV